MYVLLQIDLSKGGKRKRYHNENIFSDFLMLSINNYKYVPCNLQNSLAEIQPKFLSLFLLFCLHI